MMRVGVQAGETTSTVICQQYVHENALLCLPVTHVRSLLSFTQKSLSLRSLNTANAGWRKTVWGGEGEEYCLIRKLNWKSRKCIYIRTGDEHFPLSVERCPDLRPKLGKRRAWFLALCGSSVQFSSVLFIHLYCTALHAPFYRPPANECAVSSPPWTNGTVTFSVCVEIVHLDSPKILRTAPKHKSSAYNPQKSSPRWHFLAPPPVPSCNLVVGMFSLIVCVIQSPSVHFYSSDEDSEISECQLACNWRRWTNSQQTNRRRLPFVS